MEKSVDVSLALEELGISLKDYISLINDLKKHLERVMPELCTACQKSDFTAVKRLSHDLKGGLLNLRFFAAAAVAKKLESAAVKGEAGNLPKLQNALRRAFRAGLEQIEAYF
jgi:HPt (histidine-containing phosphotransfer) domain-containing protein